MGKTTVFTINLELVEKYNNKEFSLSELATMHKVAPSTFRKKAKEEDILLRAREVYIKTNFDSEEMSYFLGFYLADGCLNPKNRFSITTSIKDVEHLKILRDIINPSINIHISTKKYKVSDTDYISNEMCVLSFTNIKLAELVTSWGMGNRKTFLTKKLPSLSNINMNHFIRGYFDGDGSISISNGYRTLKGKIYKNRQLAFSITSWDKVILEDIQKYFLENNISTNIRSTKNSFSLEVYSKKEILKIYHLLYDNATIYLNRKFDKFKMINLESQESQTE